MVEDRGVERFHDIHCPGCNKRLPLQVMGEMVGLVIRYQCRNCKRLLHIKDGAVPVIMREAPTERMKRPTD
jgi:hypothetical protein